VKGKLVVLSGPSGVGKDTLIDAWSAVNSRVIKVITYTTRQPREGEINGVHYHFVSQSRFDQLAREGAFWERKQVHDHWYASPRKDTEKLLAEGRIAVLRIDVQGALEVMRQRPDAITIFIMPPSMSELEERLRNRQSDSVAAVQRRLSDARFEVAQSDWYRYQVVNDSLEKAVKRLQEIVAA
jgi:guanylate kinase